jgi:hypothetical protein
LLEPVGAAPPEPVKPPTSRTRVKRAKKDSGQGALF